MIEHPDLRALRGDPALQRKAQDRLFAAVGAWQERDPAAEVLAEVKAFARARSLAECTALSALFEDGGMAAIEFASGFVEEVARTLSEAPLAQVPLRHFTDGSLSTLVLAREGPVTLTLVCTTAERLRGLAESETAQFPATECWEVFVAGRGRAELIERRPAPGGSHSIRRTPLSIEPGRTVCRDAQRQALHLLACDGNLVSLRLQRRKAGFAATDEIGLRDGAIVRRSAGDPLESRVELAMAILGRMGRADAAPHMAAIARESGSQALRWQALRECLSLDTLAGFTVLTEIARSPSDELAPAAGALRSQLVEAHPELDEVVPCPA